MILKFPQGRVDNEHTSKKTPSNPSHYRISPAVRGDEGHQTSTSLPVFDKAALRTRRPTIWEPARTSITHFKSYCAHTTQLINLPTLAIDIDRKRCHRCIHQENGVTSLAIRAFDQEA